MLTKTTETAVQTLIYIAGQNSDNPLSPKHVADELKLSPSYLAKIMRILTKASILKSHKGALGGVTLGKDPADITFLSIIEASQGQLLQDFCEEKHVDLSCGFYQAMYSAHVSLMKILSSWSLADLVNNPCHGAGLPKRRNCRVYTESAVKSGGASIDGARR